MQRGVKSRCCMMQRGVNLAATFCSGESKLVTAWCSGESSRCLPQKSSHYVMQQGVKSLICIIQRGVKSYRRMMQQGVKSTDFGRLPRPLKGPWRKKSHMGDLHSPIPMGIMHQNSPSLRLFFDFHDAARSQTSKSNKSTKLKQKTNRFKGVNRGPRWYFW